MAASRPLSCPSSRAKTTVARSSSPAAIARMRTPSPARKAKGFLASSSSPLSSSASSLFVRRRGCSALPPDWADAFSLPDDENENNDDDSEFVYEKITLLTADGVVVLPGRKLRRSSLEGGSPSVRARWRREAEERRRKEQREARRGGGRGRGCSPSLPVIPASAEREAAVRALEATLPGTWARGSVVSAVSPSPGEDGASSPRPSSSSASGLLVFASPFAVSASNGVDRGRVVRLDGYTRCPEALGAAVESAARSLRGGLVGAGTRRRPPPPGSHLSAGLFELEVALPALHGVPPALDAFVAAICEGGRGLFGGESEAGFETSAHVVERISKSWFLGGRD